MKGQVVLVWIIGMLTIFVIAMLYFVFVPLIGQDIGDRFSNLTDDFDQSSSSNVKTIIDRVRIFFPMALLIIAVGVIIYMVAAMQREEPHADII